MPSWALTFDTTIQMMIQGKAVVGKNTSKHIYTVPKMTLKLSLAKGVSFHGNQDWPKIQTLAKKLILPVAKPWIAGDNTLSDALTYGTLFNLKSGLHSGSVLYMIILRNDSAVILLLNVMYILRHDLTGWSSYNIFATAISAIIFLAGLFGLRFASVLCIAYAVHCRLKSTPVVARATNAAFRKCLAETLVGRSNLPVPRLSRVTCHFCHPAISRSLLAHVRSLNLSWNKMRRAKRAPPTATAMATAMETGLKFKKRLAILSW
jgi:hypothetical protein